MKHVQQKDEAKESSRRSSDLQTSFYNVFVPIPSNGKKKFP